MPYLLPFLFCTSQVKALDAEAVEACPHKGAIEAADEIRGLLDGSRQVRLPAVFLGSLLLFRLVGWC